MFALFAACSCDKRAYRHVHSKDRALAPEFAELSMDCAFTPRHFDLGILSYSALFKLFTKVLPLDMMHWSFRGTCGQSLCIKSDTCLIGERSQFSHFVCGSIEPGALQAFPTGS